MGHACPTTEKGGQEEMDTGMHHGLTQLKTVQWPPHQDAAGVLCPPQGRPALLEPSELGAQTPHWR